LSYLDTILVTSCLQKFIEQFSEIWRSKSHTSGRKLISGHAFHICCPIWAKVCIRDLNVVLVTICEFGENWRREGAN